MDSVLNKQTAAVALLANAVASFIVAFGIADTTLVTAGSGVLSSIGSFVLIYLHRKGQPNAV